MAGDIYHFMHKIVMHVPKTKHEIIGNRRKLQKKNPPDLGLGLKKTTTYDENFKKPPVYPLSFARNTNSIFLSRLTRRDPLPG
jgi:hypothetical protein